MSMSFAYFLDPSTKAGEGMVEVDIYDTFKYLVDFIVKKKQLSNDIPRFKEKLKILYAK